MRSLETWATCDATAKSSATDAHACPVPQGFDPATMLADLESSDIEFKRWLENELGHGVPASAAASQQCNTGVAVNCGGLPAVQQHAASCQGPFAKHQGVLNHQQVPQQQAQQQYPTAQQANPFWHPTANNTAQLQQQQNMLMQQLLNQNNIQQQPLQQQEPGLQEYCRQQQQQLHLEQLRIQQQMEMLHQQLQPRAQQQQQQRHDGFPQPVAANGAAALPSCNLSQPWNVYQQQQQTCAGFSMSGFAAAMQPIAAADATSCCNMQQMQLQTCTPALVAAAAAGHCYGGNMQPPAAASASSFAAQQTFCFAPPILMMQQSQQQLPQQTSGPFQQGLTHYNSCNSSGLPQPQAACAGNASMLHAASLATTASLPQQGRSSGTSGTAEAAAGCNNSGSAGYVGPGCASGAVHGRVKRNNSTVTTATAGAAAGATVCVKKKGPSTRFRERQRATISSLETQLCEKLSQLRVLTTENEKLKLRAAVLEATVTGREYHLKVLKEHVQHVAGTPKSGAGSAHTAHTADSAGLSTHSTEAAQSSCSGGRSQASCSEVHSDADLDSGNSDGEDQQEDSNTGTRREPHAAVEAAGTDAASTGNTDGDSKNDADGETIADAMPMVAAAMEAEEQQQHATPAAAAAAVQTADAKPSPEPPQAPTAAAVMPHTISDVCEDCCCSKHEQQQQHQEDGNVGNPPRLQPICCMRHMSTERIIQHWKQFLQEVSQELLHLEQEEAAQQHFNNTAAVAASNCHNGTKTVTAAAAAAEEAKNLSDALAAVAAASKACKWCGGGGKKSSTRSVFGDVGNCATAFAAAAPSVTAAAAAAAVAEPAAGAAVAEPAAGAAVAEPAAGAAAVTADAAFADGCTPSGRRIIALVERYSYMTKYVAMLHPGMLYRLFGRNLDSGLPLPYDDDHWRQVVAHLGLRQQQVTAIMECAELYFSSLSKLLDARRTLEQQLQQQLEADMAALCGPSKTDAAAAVSVQPSSCCSSSSSNLHALQLLDLLSANLQREHVLRSMLKCFVWGRILDSIQFAKAAVYSHPLFPDLHAIVCTLYKSVRNQQDTVGEQQKLKGLRANGLHQEQQQCQVQAQQQQEAHSLMPLMYSSFGKPGC